MTSRFVRNALVAAGCALAIALAPLDAARATTFAELTIEQYTDAAEYIVRGDVQEVWTELDENGRVWTRARVAVTETVKGPDKPAELIIDSLGGTFGDFTLQVPGQAVFSEHETLFVFLTRLSDDRLVPISKFQGKYTVRRAPGETREHLMTYHPRAGLTFDARFLPHPAPEDRVYLDDLKDQVRDRLEAGWDGKPIQGLTTEQLQRLNTIERRMPR